MHPFRKIAATVALGAMTTLAGVNVATAQNFQWQTNAYNDASNGGRYTAFLTLGVPETDNRQFQASCSPRGQSAVLGYNTGNLQNGRQVIVGFYQNGREVYAKSGTVYHGDTEEGVAGVRFDPEVNDGLWVTLQRGSRIRYRIDGLPMASMTLRGSTRTIKRYRRDCQAILNASYSGGDDSDNEENNVAGAPSCNAFGNLRSINSGQAVTIRFTNNSGAHRSVMWIDYQGQPKQYKDLAPGQSYAQQTFVGHPWMFTDGPGNCKEIFIPQGDGRTRYSINFSD